MLQRATSFATMARRLCYHGTADVIARSGRRRCSQQRAGLLHEGPALLQRATGFAALARRLCYHVAAALLHGTAGFAARKDQRCYLDAGALLPMARWRGGDATGAVRRCYKGPTLLLLHRSSSGFFDDRRGRQRRCTARGEDDASQHQFSGGASEGILRRRPLQGSPVAPATGFSSDACSDFSGHARNGSVMCSREEQGRGKRAPCAGAGVSGSFLEIFCMKKKDTCRLIHPGDRWF